MMILDNIGVNIQDACLVAIFTVGEKIYPFGNCPEWLLQEYNIYNISDCVLENTSMPSKKHHEDQNCLSHGTPFSWQAVWRVSASIRGQKSPGTLVTNRKSNISICTTIKDSTLMLADKCNKIARWYIIYFTW